VLGDHHEVVTGTLTQRRSKLSLSEIAVGHAEALHSTVVLQHKEFVNLHPDSPLRGRREGDIAHVGTSLSSPAAGFGVVPPVPSGFLEAAGQGFEPQLPGPEPGVLPLDDPATAGGVYPAGLRGLRLAELQPVGRD
jgi:hypothetical protein